MDTTDFTDDFTEDEWEALGELGAPEDQTTEFAVIYHRKRKAVVEGPYPRSLAERKARDRGGRVVERTVTTLRGLWTPADPRFAEFDISVEGH